MNLDNPISSCRHRIVSPKTIPLLVLVKEWSSRQEEAMMDTRCILYLLQVLQKVLSKHETVSFVKLASIVSTFYYVTPICDENYFSE